MTKSCRHGGLRYQVGELGDLNDAFSGFPYSPVLTWDTERAEAEALRGELSEAFEARHRELQTAQAQIARHIE